jgi:hypothetical protein
MTNEAAAYLEERFQGEVYGEAIFRVMAERATDPAIARKLRVIEQLERETKEVLRPATRAAGNEGVDSADAIRGGEELGAKLARVPWPALLVGLEKELAGFVAQFEAAEAMAPPGSEALFRHVTEHERALLDFVVRERAGAPADEALAPITALLREPCRLAT